MLKVNLAFRSGVAKMYSKSMGGSLGSKKVQKENIYSKEIRETLVDEDALHYEEDGFMEGYGDEEFIDDLELEEDDFIFEDNEKLSFY